MKEPLSQTAPWPDSLEDLVARCRYRAHEGWKVELRRMLERDTDAAGRAIGIGTTLVITTCGYDSYHPENGRNYRVNHYFIVPAATYAVTSWQRWLIDRYADVEFHECMEHFAIEDTSQCRHCGSTEEGDHSCPCPDRDEECTDHPPVLIRPYAPLHGPGENPYVLHEHATQGQVDRRYFDHTGRD